MAAAIAAQIGRAAGPGDRQEAGADQDRAANNRTIAATEDAADPEQAARSRPPQTAASSSGTERGNAGKRQQGEGHQGLESAALKGTFLEPIDLEDRQEQRQVREVEQERPEAAAARLGLARIEARPDSGCGQSPGCRGAGRIREQTADAAPASVSG